MGGGLGLMKREVCGALSGGAMVIGALNGRVEAAEDDGLCAALTRRYYDRFVERFGDSNCGSLRAHGFGSPDGTPCAELVEGAANLLLMTLSEAEDRPGVARQDPR